MITNCDLRGLSLINKVDIFIYRFILLLVVHVLFFISGFMDIRN